jgi:prolyl 4-hydroxylase
MKKHDYAVVAVVAAAVVATVALLKMTGEDMSCMEETFMSEEACVRPMLHDDFLRPEECAGIVAAAKAAGLSRSEVWAPEGDAISKYRTSDQVFLPLSTPAVEPFVRRVEELVGVPRTHFEDVQVVRYRPTQRYDAHFDSDEQTPEDEVRLHTVLCYLNDGFEGGETAFPTAHVTVAPKRGMAVHWTNVDPSGGILPCGFHAARPVRKGVKWACTIWVRVHKVEG